MRQRCDVDWSRQSWGNMNTSMDVYNNKKTNFVSVMTTRYRKTPPFRTRDHTEMDTRVGEKILDAIIYAISQNF